VSTEASVEEPVADPGTKTYTTIDVPGGTFQAGLDINDHGVIVGRYRRVSDGRTFGYRRSETGELTTIEYPGANETNPWDIDRRGRIVGSFGTLDGRSHLFVLSDGEFSAIDVPGVVDINQDKGGINARGDIVGVYCDAAPCKLGPTGTHGFVLADGDLTPIDIPGAPATVTFGINARRDIVGAYYDAKGEAHGFLLSWRKQNEK
jgi:hypothetical protein